MNTDTLEIIQKLDNDLYENVTKTREMTFKKGALSTKTKLLIALALDASKGAQDGVKSFVNQALKAGATKDEIMESIRVANYIYGASSALCVRIIVAETNYCGGDNAKLEISYNSKKEYGFTFFRKSRESYW